MAPAAVEVARDHVRLEYQYARVLVVVGYPRTVAPGWLTPLVEFEHPLEVSLHVHPLETASMVKLLGHKLVQLQSSRLVDVRGGRLADPEREVAFEDAERLRDALQRGEERVFSVSLYVLLRAGSPRALDDLTRRVETTLDGMLAHSRVAILEQERALPGCLPTAATSCWSYRNLDTSSLATTFPFTSSSLSMERGVLYGVATRSQSPVIVDPFDASLENANLAVFADGRRGQELLRQADGAAKPAGRRRLPGDRSRKTSTARCARPSAASTCAWPARSAQHLNPFDLPPAGRGDDGGHRRAGRAGRQPCSGLLEVMLAEPGAQARAPTSARCSTCALCRPTRALGITRDPATHDRPAPLLRDLHAVLAARPSDVAAPAWRRAWRATSAARWAPACSPGRPTSSSTGGWWCSTSSSSKTSCGRWRCT